MFTIAGTGDKLWNISDLTQYLCANQNSVVDLKVNPEAICLQNLGVYDLLDCFKFQQVNLYTNNPLEKHFKYNILYKENYVWFDQQMPIDKTLHVWNQQKIFYCLFGRPTAGRLGLASYLLEHHAQQSLIHFSAVTDVDNLEQFELNKLLSYRQQSIGEAGKLINQLPLLLSGPERYTAFNGYDYTDPLTNFYRDIFVDIVVESHVAGKTFYATEKTVRPMLLKKPFIVFASKDYLDYLHQMGFLTFYEFWSEHYDGFEGRDRFGLILDLLDSLATKSLSELNSMYNSMQHILNHNYDLIINGKFKKQIQEIQ
jgi:hypothetical protein